MLEKIADLNNKFAFEMFSNLTGEKQENTFFSPHSITSAFAMVFEGAKGKTREEIRSVFHFLKDDKNRRESTQEILLELNKPDKKYILRSANALWVQDDFPILKEFGEVAKKYYLVTTENLDFKTNTEGSRQKINMWIEEKTNGKIKDALTYGSVGSWTLAVITNAVYFFGRWSSQFDAKLTKNSDFKISKQKTVKVPMMNLREYFHYTSKDDLQILQVPYEGDDLSMLVLLPKNNDLRSLEKKLSATNFNKWKDGLMQKRVQVYLPKFTLDTGYQLASSLAKMGISFAFNHKKANFEGISGGKDLFVSDVIHRVFIEVDEKGTEAAAATVMVMIPTGRSRIEPPEIFRADHPFIFLIVNDKTGMILFMGKVVNPTENSH